MSLMRKWWLLGLLLTTHLPSSSQAATQAEHEEVVEVLALDLQKSHAKRVASEIIYDHIIIKFDPACSDHKDLNLDDYIEQQLSKYSSGESSKPVAGFASVGDEHQPANKSQATRRLPDPASFKALLAQHLDDARVVVGAQSMQPKVLNGAEGGEQQDPFSPSLSPTKGRRLGDAHPEQREEEILSALHLLAAAQLIGPAHVGELLSLEKRGSWKEALDLVKKNAQIDLNQAALQRVYQRLEAKQSTRNTTLTRTILKKDPGPGKVLQNESAWMSHQALPVITDTETLHGLGMRLIQNPLLGSDLLTLATLLPCAAFTPEADRTKEALGDPPTTHQAPSEPIYKTYRHIKETNLTVTPGGVGKPSETKSDDSSFQAKVSAVEKTFLGLFTSKDAQSATDTPNTKYTLTVPNDQYFANQWYLRGPSQKQPYGAQIIDGWSALLREQFLNASSANSSLSEVALEFANLADIRYGMTVAVLDSGCSRHADLINQFWRNPNTSGCTPQSFVGDEVGKSATTDVTGDCVGYDFGNDQPDPTQEVEGKIHGSSTSGLIGAEADNNSGIAGVCPKCKIMCLKIYDSDQQKITMSSVLRALNYVAEKGVKVSNHSYGGFGASEAEMQAHSVLNELGHLSICSSGNNGCDLDSRSGSDACMSEDGAWLGPFTPASYDLPNILSVGGTTETGELAWFSNYGKSSVDIFAPGSDIITLYGKTQYASVKGTSFSAPIVAGMAAVLWSYKPELTSQEVKDIILKTGTHVDSLKGKAKTSKIASLARMLGSDGLDVTTVGHSDGCEAIGALGSALPLMLLIIVILIPS